MTGSWRRRRCSRAVLAEHGRAGGDRWRFGQRAAPADFARAGAADARRRRRPATRRRRRSSREAEAEVARAIDRLLADGPLPVCFLGGLGPVFAARLAGRYGGLIRAPRGSGLDGALALARRLG